MIRKIKKEDTKSISHVVTVAWNETYKGIVPDYFLEELKQNESERAQKFLDTFDTNPDKSLVLEIDDEIVGFVRYGASNDTDFNNCGEIIALYIIKKYHGYGFGRELVKEASKELIKMGFDKMIISCLKGNKSNDFYKHIGGIYVKDGIYRRLNLPENVYLFNNLSEIIKEK